LDALHGSEKLGIERIERAFIRPGAEDSGNGAAGAIE
jgi:hypothetical protein